MWSFGGNGGAPSARSVCMVLLAAALGSGALAATSVAKKAGNPEFEEFAHCPVYLKKVSKCLVAHTTSGEFKLGKKTVHITKTLTLQGGLTEGSTELVPPVEAEELTRVPIEVPGGLTGIEGLSLGSLTEVTATTELAGPVQVDQQNLTGRGPAIVMPVKVRLENPALGSECLIGSEAEPITLDLTVGTTSPPAGVAPITGDPGTVSFNSEQTILTISGQSFVENDFAVPGASGCGGILSPVLDALVDLQVGLPAAPGESVARLNGSSEVAAAKLVKKAKVVPKS